MSEKEAKILFDRYKNGLCTEAEIALLESWYLEHAREKSGPAPDHQLLENRLDRIWQSLPVHSDKRHYFNVSVKQLMAVAASVILMTAFGLFLYRSQKIGPETGRQEVGTRAERGIYIVLDDGQKISVNKQSTGRIFENVDTRIRKTADQRIVYEAQDQYDRTKPLRYNTVVIPKGVQYQLMLVDGTKVWLNANSSIRFPTQFSGEQRQVEVSGEAYFEVAKDVNRPFLVKTANQAIKVLGTHFNVQAYEDEPVTKTTLLEGSVEVHLAISGAEIRQQPNLVQVLEPGEQAQVRAGENKLTVKKVNARESVNWKNGVTTFKNADLGTILRQISRWYAIEIQYEGAVPDRHFTGGFSISAPLSDFLKILTLNGIQFEKKEHILIIKSE